MADLDAVVAQVRRALPASPEAVFDEWLDPEALSDWMCPRPARCLKVETEPWVGGRVRFDIEDSGSVFFITGRYLTIDRPRRLAFTWSCSTWADPGLESVVTVTLEPHAGQQTLMTIEHALLPPGLVERHAHGWTRIAGQLDAALRGTASPAWLITAGEHDPGTVERLLRSLPEWFGVESSITEYVEAARRLPAYLAWPRSASQVRETGDQPAGVLLGVRHFPWSAEIYLMAGDRAFHRRGAGRALVEAFEADLARDQVEFLQVKTLGPAHPDEGYGRTRQFYTRLGFRPLEEIHDLWPENPCLIMVKALSGRRHRFDDDGVEVVPLR